MAFSLSKSGDVCHSGTNGKFLLARGKKCFLARFISIKFDQLEFDQILSCLLKFKKCQRVLTFEHCYWTE